MLLDTKTSVALGDAVFCKTVSSCKQNVEAAAFSLSQIIAVNRYVLG